MSGTTTGTTSGRIDAVLRAATTMLAIFAVGLVLLGMAWPSGHRAHVPPAAPIRVSAASIHLAARVVPITLDGGVLTPPSDVSEVGWWRGSALPGADAGKTVMTGHTVHTGGGVLDRLGSVRAGQRVRVITKRSTVLYTVRSAQVLSHEQLARRSRSLFGQTSGNGELVLVTCEDWNGVTYVRNLVVTADRTGASSRPVSPGSGRGRAVRK